MERSSDSARTSLGIHEPATLLLLGLDTRDQRRLSAAAVEIEGGRAVVSTRTAMLLCFARPRKNLCTSYFAMRPINSALGNHFPFAYSIFLSSRGDSPVRSFTQRERWKALEKPHCSATSAKVRPVARINWTAWSVFILQIMAEGLSP